jgi:hypothetical protein
MPEDVLIVGLIRTYRETLCQATKHSNGEVAYASQRVLPSQPISVPHILTMTAIIERHAKDQRNHLHQLKQK